jgi:hypothetical protein
MNNTYIKAIEERLWAHEVVDSVSRIGTLNRFNPVRSTEKNFVESMAKYGVTNQDILSVDFNVGEKDRVALIALGTDTVIIGEHKSYATDDDHETIFEFKGIMSLKALWTYLGSFPNLYRYLSHAPDECISYWKNPQLNALKTQVDWSKASEKATHALITTPKHKDPNNDIIYVSLEGSTYWHDNFSCNVDEGYYEIIGTRLTDKETSINSMNTLLRAYRDQHFSAPWLDLFFHYNNKHTDIELLDDSSDEKSHIVFYLSTDEGQVLFFDVSTCETFAQQIDTEGRRYVVTIDRSDLFAPQSDFDDKYTLCSDDFNFAKDHFTRLINR